jgi:anaerobic sulfite reductase subunit A
MRTLKLNAREAQIAFRAIAEDYAIVAPKVVGGRGRFSDTDLVTYEPVDSLSEIEFSAKTYFSAKSVLFPVRETMFAYDGESVEEAPADVRPTIVFLRACDIHALRVLDAMFLAQGDREDCYYARRRKNVTCFLMECARPFDECFCVSTGTSRTDAYSVFLGPREDGYAVQIPDGAFERYFPRGAEAAVAPRFAREDPRPVVLPKSVDESVFGHELWQEYSRRCIACGRCNTSCPTCSCFTVQDIPDDRRPGRTERRRIWSSCQVKRFSRLAGDHEFRAPKGDRMRYKVLHKIRDFGLRFGFPMCVGCGRCDLVCPEYISMANCIEKIAAIGATDREGD